MERCRKTVYSKGGWVSGRRCSRNVWKDGYCKQHHPESIKARNEQSAASWEEKRKQQPLYLLEQAKKRIAELEAEVIELRSRDGVIITHNDDDILHGKTATKK